MKSKIVRDMTLISLFAALIAVTSFIAIPIGTLPITLQTFGVFSTLILLGGRRGSISVAVYIALGAVGLPVFSGFQGGFAVLFGATGGYIIGFLLAALVFWSFEKILGMKRGAHFLSVWLGMLVCYAVGTLWYALVYMGGTGIGFAAAVAQCVLPFILPDIAKITLAFVMCKRLKKYMK
jgi:biotin transport system substrate-specific component